AVATKLAPLAVPLGQGGPGLIEELGASPPAHLSDFYTHVAVSAENFEKSLRVFVRNFLDAVREGYFPIDRFLNLFPMPPALKKNLWEKSTTMPVARPRQSTPLGLKFKPATRRPPGSVKVDWKSRLVAFTKEEIKQRFDLRTFGSQQPGFAEIELAEAML